MAVMTWQYVLLCRTTVPSIRRQVILAQRSACWLVALALLASPRSVKMIDDQQLGFLANFLGIFIFALVIAYHYVAADPKYEGN
ncbi:Oligosaccaryltransferase [Corchorus capsularis]|uniref:Oligosaccaryltransferase n=1 Tax=Corchorus capsularis TaxID=210143 RepID=A0A1R3GLF1_COCAP|nr:Oligosaccaryltransferase [Corchorus capsularis]